MESMRRMHTEKKKNIQMKQLKPLFNILVEDHIKVNTLENKVVAPRSKMNSYLSQIFHSRSPSGRKRRLR